MLSQKHQNHHVLLQELDWRWRGTQADAKVEGKIPQQLLNLFQKFIYSEATLTLTRRKAAIGETETITYWQNLDYVGRLTAQ